MINNIMMNILHKILAFGNSEAFVSKRSDVMVYLPSFIEQSIEVTLVILAWSINLTDELMRTFTNKCKHPNLDSFTVFPGESTAFLSRLFKVIISQVDFHNVL